ncbi:MAG TPA: hypothetical protein VLJ58_00960 [Ramlibacter sp.]|nr:hypothetical protein [Ramlibacter sp.]
MATPASRVISFRDNVANRHGETYRSSAIFHLPPTDRVRTRISFLNYWALKRDLQVAVVASTRAMDGGLVGRERLRFERGPVVNYSPPVPEGFEGSVEIEVFAADNLVIPYAAIVAWYETARGIGIVHSYARAYSAHEVEEGRTLTRGREACWSVADDGLTRSFCVFHNGSAAVPPQPIRLAVRTAQGERLEARWQLEALAPYQSVRIEPADHIAGLVERLAGQVGQAEIDFELGEGFTRMLVGHRRDGWEDLQVTHSNFNFTLQPTDMAGAGALGWMEVPALDVERTEVVVYPQTVQGHYRVRHAGGVDDFRTGETLTFAPGQAQTLCFDAAEGALPTRLVTALRVAGSPGQLSNECSLGVITALQPPKRLWWGPIRCDEAQSQLLVHDLPQVWKGLPADAVLLLRLFSAARPEPLQAQWPADGLPQLARGVAVDAIWPSAHEFLAGEPGYYTLYCDYGGLTAYTLTRNGAGSVCLEHGF